MYANKMWNLVVVMCGFGLLSIWVDKKFAYKVNYGKYWSLQKTISTTPAVKQDQKLQSE